MSASSGSGNVLVRKNKGKSIAVDSSPAIDATTNEPLQDFRLAHRDALTDTNALDTPQRTLVDDMEKRLRDEDNGSSASDAGGSGSSRSSGYDATRSDVDGPGNTEVRPTPVPILFHDSGHIEELPQIEPEMRRSPILVGQAWPKIRKTASSTESVMKLFTSIGAKGVTFLIPTDEERPWSPPMGYQTLYEAYFEKDAMLRFPVPRLFTSYVFRRKIALSQLGMAGWRLGTALSVLAAEIGMSLSVRAFEELSSFTPEKDGFYTTKMRSTYNIITGHPGKTADWHRKYFFVKSDKHSFEEPPTDSFRVLWNSCFGRALHPVNLFIFA